MTKKTDLSTGRHCVFSLHVHLVFVTKYRRRVFSRAILNEMQLIFGNVCAGFEAQPVEFDGEADHVHLLVYYPPKFAVARLVNRLKGVSSRLLRTRRPVLVRCFRKCVLWSPSCFAGSCGGAPIEIVRQYIEQQETPP